MHVHACLAEAGLRGDQLGHVVEGLVTGIGFLGAGTILKLTAEREIRGLTTAANLWVAAAIGMAVGMGWLIPAVLVVVSAWVVLVVLKWLEPWLKEQAPKSPAT
jgi:putative Mg2+ transporter-C (MgtC) family protein